MGVGIRVSRGLGILLAAVALTAGLGAFRRGVTAEEAWGTIWPWAVALAAAAAHEAGHWVAAWGVGVPVRGIFLDMLGARMELAGTPSYGQELFVAAAGPFVSLVGAGVAYPLAAAGSGVAEVFFGASLVFGGVNLLPIGTLDGGRMLRCVVASLWGDRAAVGTLRVTTGICLGLLWLLAAYGLLRGSGFLSAFVFSLCLLERAVGGGTA